MPLYFQHPPNGVNFNAGGFNGTETVLPSSGHMCKNGPCAIYDAPHLASQGEFATAVWSGGARFVEL